jgi:hypothetical protein
VVSLILVKLEGADSGQIATMSDRLITVAMLIAGVLVPIGLVLILWFRL